MKRVMLLSVAMMLAWTALARAEEKIEAPKNDQGAYVLFNGKDLSGWEGDAKFWSVKDGCITGSTKENKTNGNTFLIWRGGKVKDFELRVMWRLENHNSGIQYRSKDLGNFVVGGYQADMDGGNNYTGICYEERGRGIIAQVGQKVELNENEKPKAVGSTGDAKEIKAGIKKAGEWNEYIVTARGNHLVQKLNGNVTVEITDNDTKKRMMEGILALQLHAGEPMLVQFKEITLKVLE